MKIASLLSAIAQIAIACAIGAIAFVLHTYLPTVQTYVKHTATQDCAIAYRSEYQDAKTNTTVSQPIPDLYEQCLKDKGLK